MNKTLYKVIFSRKNGCTVAVAETAKCRGKSSTVAVSGSVSAANHLRNDISRNIRSFLSRLTHLPPVPFSLLFLALLPAFVAAEGIVADKSAPKNRRPTVLQTANGTPQVNIQTPTAAGVSVNQYTQFDIGGKGAVLNNSRTPVQTQLGGRTAANPWLAGREARVVVNQINSSRPSQLNGYIEIGGRRAELVVANPAGIRVDGAGFINTPHAILTTGQPQYRAAALDGFAVHSGSVEIAGQGLDARGADATRIFSRSVKIDAPVWGKDILVRTGQNRVAADGIFYTPADVSNPAAQADSAPLYAFDSGTLGGMYADKITLIATAPGAAVRNRGQLFASAGGVSVRADGRLDNSGVIAATGQNNAVSLQAAAIDNSGTIASQDTAAADSRSLDNSGTVLSAGKLTLHHSGNLNNRSGGRIQAARVDMAAGRLDNAGHIVQTGVQDLDIGTAGQLSNSGSIGTAENTSAAPAVEIPGGTAGAGGTFVQNTGTPASVSGSPAAASAEIYTAGQIRADTLNNSGSITANGAIRGSAQGGLDNSGSLKIGELHISGAALDNSGHLQTQTLAADTRTARNSGSIMTRSGKIRSHTLHNGGTIDGGTLVLKHSGSLNNAQTGAIRAADLQLDTAALDNAGNILAESGGIDTQDNLRNRGNIAVARLHTAGQVSDNTQGQITAETADIHSRQLSNLNGSITAAERLTVRSQSIGNQNGRLLSAKNTGLEVSGSLNNQNGTIAANEKLLIRNAADSSAPNALHIDNNGGIIRAGDVSLQAQSLHNNGTLTAGNDLHIALQDGFNVERDIVAGGGLHLDISGSLNNTHTLQGGRSVNIQAAAVVNAASGSIQSDNATGIAVRQNLDNRGLIDAQHTRIQAAQIDNSGTGRIYGTHLSVAADLLTNRNENGKGAVIAARQDLNLGIARLNNRENGLIYSGGDMAVGGALDAEGRATGKAQSIHNTGATLEAAGKMHIGTQTLRNDNAHLQTEWVETARAHITDYEAHGRNERLPEGTQQSLGWEVFKDESLQLRTPDGATHDQWHKYDYTQATRETQVVQTAPGKMISGGGLNIDAQEVWNSDSQIIAGGKLNVQTADGGLHNGQTFGKKEISVENGTLHRYWRQLKKGRDETGHSVAPYSLPPQTTQNISLGSFAYEEHRSALSHSAPDKRTGLQLEHWDAVRTADNPVTPLYKDDDNVMPLPASSLFVVHPENSGYLVETDPRFADYRRWLDSSYMLDALPAGNLHKRLGDGYYEQRLINEQITALTGRRHLDGYTNDEAQFKALMDNGIGAAKALNLSLGIALSAEQIARLTSDIVWPVQKTVRLADGSTQTVLVPQVYARVRNGDIDGQGTLLAGKDTLLDISGSLKNTGTIAGQNTLLADTGSLDNTGGRIHAQQAAVYAENDIDNTGGTLSAQQTLLLQAGGDINSRSTTAGSGDGQNGSTYIDRSAGIYITGSENGILALQAKHNVRLAGTQIHNRSAQGQTQLQAGRDIRLDTVHTQSRHTDSFDAHNRMTRAAADETGSSIQAQGDILLLAGNNLHARAAAVGSTEGTLTVAAKNDIGITAGIGMTEADDISRHRGRSGGGNKLTITDNLLQHSETARDSTFDGKKVRIQAGRDIHAGGSNIISDNGTLLQAGRDVRIDTAQTRSRSESYRRTQKSGLMRAGIGFTIGSKAETQDNRTAGTAHSGSTIGSLKGDTVITAGRHYSQSGSTISSPEGNNTIAAQSIRIEAAHNHTQSDSSQTFEQKGLTVAFNSPVTDLAQSAVAVAQKSRQTGQSGNARVNAMAAANTGYQTYQTAQAAQNLANGKTSAKEVSISITYGRQKNRQSSRIQTDEAQASRILGKGQTLLAATGSGTESDITVTGSDILGENRTVLAADNHIRLESAAQTGSERSHSQSSGVNAGIAVSAGQGGWSLGITAGGNLGKGHGNGDSTTHRHSRIGSADGATVLYSGADTALDGAQIFGKSIDLTARNLTIRSPQDSATYRSRQQNVSAQITAGYGVSASGSYSQSKIDAEHRSVGAQSGIFAGSGGYRLHIAEHTGLTGGLITSAQSAEDNGYNRITTGTLVHSDITNLSRYSGSSFGIGGSASVGGETLGQEKNTPENGGTANGRLTTVAEKNGADAAIGYGSGRDSRSSLTRSGINTQNLHITDEAAQIRLSGKTAQETAAQIHTGISTEDAQQYSGSLKNVFDREKVQNELDLQREVTQEFSQNVQQINAQIHQQLDTLKTRLDAGETSQTDYERQVKQHQQSSVLLNMIASGLSAPAQSAAGIAAATAAPALSYGIGQYFKELAAQNAGGKPTAQQQSAHLIAHAALGAAVAAAGGSNPLAGAAAAGTAEAAAPLLGKWLYGKENGSDLTAEEKTTVAAITNLLGTAAAGTIGGSTAAASGSLNAQSAVGNNYLTAETLEKIKKGYLTTQEAEKISQLLDKEVGNLCSKKPTGDACRTGITTQIQYIAMQEAWEVMRKDVSRTSQQTFDYLYNTPNADSRFVHYINTIDARADFFGASDQYEKNLGVGAKWFGGAESVSRAPLTGLGADGKASYMTFGAGKLLGNPDLYGWRKEAGDSLMNRGFANFKNLYNHRPDAVQWDIQQLKDEQNLLQPIHEKYLSDKNFFRGVSKLISDVDILDYKSRIRYGCKLLGYTPQQGCKP